MIEMPLRHNVGLSEATDAITATLTDNFDRRSKRPANGLVVTHNGNLPEKDPKEATQAIVEAFRDGIEHSDNAVQLPPAVAEFTGSLQTTRAPVTTNRAIRRLRMRRIHNQEQSLIQQLPQCFEGSRIVRFKVADGRKRRAHETKHWQLVRQTLLNPSPGGEEKNWSHRFFRN